MFRPYNLTSIAAWTVGSLAGNRAYYDTKARGADGRKSSVVGPPQIVRELQRKLKCIEEEIVSIANSVATEQTKRIFTLTPLIKFFAYTEWLRTNKEALKAEVRTICETTINQGYDCPSDTIRIVQETLEGWATLCQTESDNLLQQVLPQVPNPEHVLQFIREQQRGFQLDPSSFRLVDNRDEMYAQMLRAIPPRTPTRCEPLELYVAREEQKYGPFGYMELQTLLSSGNVDPKDLVAFEGAVAWVTVADFISDVKKRTAALLKAQ